MKDEKYMRRFFASDFTLASSKRLRRVQDFAEQPRQFDEIRDLNARRK